ncbi:hypothetical protein K7X08_009736 [Anisodus acutangulus]|uniref:Uncharacterized protein n=1 Tax=Anisodus acutangulus TaxID=402998 RepID=A0A9Q1N0D4_9SOLA|nr:hypothetical protein K7X08_009736 [Anisodus acutangulus]
MDTLLEDKDYRAVHLVCNSLTCKLNVSPNSLIHGASRSVRPELEENQEYDISSEEGQSSKTFSDRDESSGTSNDGDESIEENDTLFIPERETSIDLSHKVCIRNWTTHPDYKTVLLTMQMKGYGTLSQKNHI